ncbi:MAG: STAS domain-containing protein [Myxococcota bacterium]|nr:STAS domain-containing protein [Myxococcota bacterium]
MDHQPQFADALSRVRGAYLLLDGSRVERITASGVQSLLRLSHQAHSLGARTIVIAATSPLITQFNLSDALCQQIAIFSVLAPYFCPDCQLEQRHEILLSTDATTTALADVRCIRCAGTAHFDDVESVFFRFAPHCFDYNVTEVANALAQYSTLTYGDEPPSEIGASESMRGGLKPSHVTAPTSNTGKSASTRHENAQYPESKSLRWQDLVYYILAGAALAGIALVLLQWGVG